MDMTKDLLTLNGLSGDLDSADRFADLYLTVLDKAKAAGDIEQIRQMQKILFGQCLFMLAEYLREEARLKNCEEMGGVQ